MRGKLRRPALPASEVSVSVQQRLGRTQFPPRLQPQTQALQAPQVAAGSIRSSGQHPGDGPLAGRQAPPEQIHLGKRQLLELTQLLLLSLHQGLLLPAGLQQPVLRFG